jgi:hypothetical protein
MLQFMPNIRRIEFDHLYVSGIRTFARTNDRCCPYLSCVCKRLRIEISSRRGLTSVRKDGGVA